MFDRNKQMFYIVLYQNARFVSIHIEKYFEIFGGGRKENKSENTVVLAFYIQERFTWRIRSAYQALLETSDDYG